MSKRVSLAISTTEIGCLRTDGQQSPKRHLSQIFVELSFQLNVSNSLRLKSRFRFPFEDIHILHQITAWQITDLYNDVWRGPCGSKPGCNLADVNQDMNMTITSKELKPNHKLIPITATTKCPKTSTEGSRRVGYTTNLHHVL